MPAVEPRTHAVQTGIGAGREAVVILTPTRPACPRFGVCSTPRPGGADEHGPSRPASADAPPSRRCRTRRPRARHPFRPCPNHPRCRWSRSKRPPRPHRPERGGYHAGAAGTAIEPPSRFIPPRRGRNGRAEAASSDGCPAGSPGLHGQAWPGRVGAVIPPRAPQPPLPGRGHRRRPRGGGVGASGPGLGQRREHGRTT